MSWFRSFRRKRSDAESQDEIEVFLTEETADNQAREMSSDEARRQARLKFGDPQNVCESLWTRNSSEPLVSIGRDLRYAFRPLIRAPGFSIIAVSVMALCISAATQNRQCSQRNKFRRENPSVSGRFAAGRLVGSNRATMYVPFS